MAKKKIGGIEEQRKLFIEGAKFITRAAKAYCDERLEVLGIDPSTNSTGTAFHKKSGEIVTGVIASSTYGFSRYIKIEKVIRELLEDSFPFVAVEGYAHNAKWGREIAGELGGIIRRILYFKKRPLILVAPLVIKSWVRAKGKDQIMLEILDRYGIKISNSDAADAFVIQDVVYRAVLLAKDVIKNKLKDPNEVKAYLKNEEYKTVIGLNKLFKYQQTSLFRLIISQGPNCEFFLKEKPLLYAK